MSTKEECKFFKEDRCTFGSGCKFLHSNQNQSNQNQSTNNNQINNKHKHKHNQRNKLVKVNTETFEPWYDKPEMRIIIATPNVEISESDVFLLPDLFDKNDNDLYYKLLDEIDTANDDLNEIWKPWHGGTHLIADDHLKWKKQCPTFNMVIDRISSYFNMDVKATRFNLYEDLNDYKSMHFDAAAIDPKKAETQNVTIGVSFGYTRDVEFQHAKNRARVSFTLPNGMIYGFGKQVNIDWRHGIPPIKPEVIEEENKTTKNLGRISIILWGKINQIKL